jgi:chemotaxis regulatin CheY-phosphate phosphatase CheZ
MPIAWRDYDPRQEGLREKDEKLEELVQEWLDEAIDKRDLDELYEPLGDHLAEALWDAGVSEKPFKEALKEAVFARDWKSIYDYVESITEWEEIALP